MLLAFRIIGAVVYLANIGLALALQNWSAAMGWFCTLVFFGALWITQDALVRWDAHLAALLGRRQ